MKGDDELIVLNCLIKRKFKASKYFKVSHTSHILWLDNCSSALLSAIFLSDESFAHILTAQFPKYFVRFLKCSSLLQCSQAFLC